MSERQGMYVTIERDATGLPERLVYSTPAPAATRDQAIVTLFEEVLASLEGLVFAELLDDDEHPGTLEDHERTAAAYVQRYRTRLAAVLAGAG